MQNLFGNFVGLLNGVPHVRAIVVVIVVLLLPCFCSEHHFLGVVVLESAPKVF